MTEQKVGVTMSVKRGPESWAYIYTALGFTLAIEGTVIQMIEPLKYPFNLIAYVVLAPLTVWLFIDNKWLHQRLINLKIRYENKGR